MSFILVKLVNTNGYAREKLINTDYIVSIEEAYKITGVGQCSYIKMNSKHDSAGEFIEVVGGLKDFEDHFRAQFVGTCENNSTTSQSE